MPQYNFAPPRPDYPLPQWHVFPASLSPRHELLCRSSLQPSLDDINHSAWFLCTLDVLSKLVGLLARAWQVIREQEWPVHEGGEEGGKGRKQRPETKGRSR